MTVGTGVGSNQLGRISSLAHGLFSCILHFRPDKVIFFGSDQSYSTIDVVKKLYFESMKKEFSHYEFVIIQQIDSFDECFRLISSSLTRFPNTEIIIDYTSGTKTMTVSAAICSVLFHKKLSLISGKRGEYGLIISGTEHIIEQNLYSVYDKILIAKLHDSFNHYQFSTAQNCLDEIIIFDDDIRETYTALINAYRLWDKFHHESAFLKLKEISKEYAENKLFLSKLLSDSRDKKVSREYFLIADLLNNTERRVEEEKYDDATARLYRCAELIAQFRLKSSYLLDTSNIDTARLLELGLQPIVISQYDEYKTRSGVIKIGLHASYDLLCDLNDSLGFLFRKDKELKNLLSYRNDSILAHGIKPVNKDFVDKLYRKIIVFAEEAEKEQEELTKLRKLAKFPKLE